MENYCGRSKSTVHFPSDNTCLWPFPHYSTTWFLPHIFRRHTILLGWLLISHYLSLFCLCFYPHLCFFHWVNWLRQFLLHILLCLSVSDNCSTNYPAKSACGILQICSLPVSGLIHLKLWRWPMHKIMWVNSVCHAALKTGKNTWYW